MNRADQHQLLQHRDVLVVGTGKAGGAFRSGDRDLIRAIGFNRARPIKSNDAAADAFKEDFGIDVASHTGLISMFLITDFGSD